jgi:hypothetical protein
MPHKEGHWGYKTRKKIQDKVSNIGKNIKNKSKLLVDKSQKTVNKYNPQSKSNKSIRKKESIIKSDTASRKEKSVAKVQKAAHIRKRDGVTIAQVHAKNKASMENKAKNKHADWKKMKSGKLSKEAFIKRYPNSQTAKKSRKK